MLGIKYKMFKIGCFLGIPLFLIGIGVVAHNVFFREIEVGIKQIIWVEEFKIEIPEIILDEPCILVVETKNLEGLKSSEIVDGGLIIQKQNIEMGACTNRRILVPLRIENIAKNNNRPFFFVPGFRARIIGEEQLKANFSLYLKVNGVCPEGKETRIRGDGFVLCDLNISSTNVKSFSITEIRKNILAEAVKSLVNRDDYILVLEIAPDLEIIKDNNLTSFSITIENITPEVIIVR